MMLLEIDGVPLVFSDEWTLEWIREHGEPMRIGVRTERSGPLRPIALAEGEVLDLRSPDGLQLARFVSLAGVAVDVFASVHATVISEAMRRDAPPGLDPGISLEDLGFDGPPLTMERA
jgi:hypothetical protein